VPPELLDMVRRRRVQVNLNGLWQTHMSRWEYK
jgi:hypothetical protein